MRLPIRLVLADVDGTVLTGFHAIHAGGGFGSMIGRNSFQRPKAQALKMLGAMMDIYGAAPVQAGRP